MRPKVFITNDTGLDYTKAEQYGDLVPLISGPVDVFRPDATKRIIEEKLRGWKRGDYLLVSGSSLAAALAGAFLATNGEEDEDAMVQFLMFDAKSRAYFVRTVQL